MRLLASSLFTSLLPMVVLAGCMDGVADKGDEDDVPTDGKADSFRSPTEHGQVPFGSTSSAAFTDSQGFHSWTFKLTATAKVDLRTAYATPNLDTVAYLYKKSGSSWGSYIATNDDASSSTATSRINKQLGAGEYRLIVKAYKRTQRGAFGVLGACTGAGCPVPEVCEDSTGIPTQTAYTATCGTKLAAVFETGTIAQSAYQEGIAYSTRCDVSSLERKAMDYYNEYMNAFEEEDNEFFYNVETKVLSGTSATGGGTVVVVDDGGDESSMRFVFAKDGSLLAYYQDNQSPDLAFFCGEGTEVQLPNAEECISGLTSNVAHDSGDESPLSLSAAPNNLPTGTQTEVRAAFTRYAAQNGTSAATKLTASGNTWEDYGETAGIFSLTAPSKPATRYVVARSMVLVETPASGPAALVCE